MPRTFTRRTFLAAAPVTLAACSAEPLWAPDADVQAHRFVNPGVSELRLYTVRNTGSGNGAHSGLLIDASERVLYDPAGSFQASTVPERNDLLHGITPEVERLYLSYHARTQYYVITQSITVPPAVAEQALRLAQDYGAVPKANCARAISAILGQLPGFTQIDRTWFPDNLEADFAQLPGVRTEELREND